MEYQEGVQESQEIRPERSTPKYVYYTTENVWAMVLEEHAYHSRINYVFGGHEYSIMVDNEELQSLIEKGIKYEQDT